MADARRLAELGMSTELAKEVAAQIDAAVVESLAASAVTVTTFTTAGETEISGNLQEVLEEIGDLADPAG